MIELLVLGSLLFAAVVVFGVIATVVALVGGLVLLPLKILGWVLKWVVGGALMLALGLPLLLVALAVGGVGLALGLGVIVVPLLPLLAVVWLAWWLLRPRGPAKSEASGATIVG